MHFFLCTKEKSSKKEVCEPAARPPCRSNYRQRKFRPHLTQELSVQMGCHRRTADSPNRRFFPTECVRQNPSLITRPAPRAPYGHRRGLCVVIFARLCPLSVTFRATSPLGEAYEITPSAHGIHYTSHIIGASNRNTSCTNLTRALSLQSASVISLDTAMVCRKSSRTSSTTFVPQKKAPHSNCR